ncbi:MAG TPA: succinate dehydrogenase assembly factor 2, partial [Alphaproteobacteria bacterium]
MGAESSEIRRKRLRFRAWHRGTRETDLLFGGFADAHLAALDEAQL